MVKCGRVTILNVTKKRKGSKPRFQVNLSGRGMFMPTSKIEANRQAKKLRKDVKARCK